VQRFAAGDFNGDGKADMATQRVDLYMADGNGFVSEDHPITEPGYVGRDVQVADLNLDGKLDIVTLGADKVFILLGNGDGTFGPVTSFPGLPSPEGSRIEVADFNGDGKPDILELGGAWNDAKLALFVNSTFKLPLALIQPSRLTTPSSPLTK